MQRRIWDYVKYLRNFLLLAIFAVIIFICQINNIRQHEVINTITKSDVHHLFAVHDNLTTESNGIKLETLILDKTRDEIVLNQDVYGPIKEDTVVIVILMDKYSVYLKFMLYFLSQVKGIQDALLIFSHAKYDENVNALVRNIDFCRVLQIFNPYSIQLHPNSFPGFSAGDCPHDMSITEAEKLNCTGARFWDIHGHFRNPQSSERKHHWWWTANQVFENLTTTEKHLGTVVFVDDNYYFLEDFLYMTIYMKNLAGTLASCEFLSLASVGDNHDTENLRGAVEVSSWDPAVHSGVLAFDLAVWNSIVSHYNLFCDVDDCSWSQSLAYLSFNRKDGDRYRVMSSVFPRAYKPPVCSFLDKVLGCGIYSMVHQIMSLHKNNHRDLFPANLDVFVDIELQDDYLGFDVINSSGGWSDPRDKELCANITVNKIKKAVMDMNNQFDDDSFFEH